MQDCKIQSPTHEKINAKDKEIASHLSHCVPKGLPYDQKFGAFFLLKTWADMTKLTAKFGSSSISELQLSKIQSESWLCGNGCCLGAVISHFDCFLKTRDPLKSIFPVDDLISAKIAGESNTILLHRFSLDKEALENSSRLRFVQAAHLLSGLFPEAIKKRKQDISSSPSFFSEVIPARVLKKFNLQMSQRIPAHSEGKSGCEMEDFIPQLQQLTSQNKMYVLGINDGRGSHAIGVHLEQPFHFIDFKYGIVTAENRDDMILFLANFLTEKYTNFNTFALLELAPLRS